MLDGKRFLPVTGMPMRKIACRRRPFALAEPVPFTVAILKAKLFVRPAEEGDGAGRFRSSGRAEDAACRRPFALSGWPSATMVFFISSRQDGELDAAGLVAVAPRVGNLEGKLLHVPRGGRAAIGA